MPPAELRRRAPAVAQSGDGQLGVVRHMLRDLETATMAGRPYVMGKIVAVLECELRGQALPVTQQEMRVVARALDELAFQSTRVAPDIQLFRRRVELLLDLLEVAARS
jgi:hypothetical protein